MTQIHTLNLCLKTIGKHCKPEHQPANATHTQPSAKHPASRPPRQPASWPFGQRFANCLSTFCQHVANLLPTFCQPAVSTCVYQCFALFFFDIGKPFCLSTILGLANWMANRPLAVLSANRNSLAPTANPPPPLAILSFPTLPCPLPPCQLPACQPRLANSALPKQQKWAPPLALILFRGHVQSYVSFLWEGEEGWRALLWTPPLALYYLGAVCIRTSWFWLLQFPTAGSPPCQPTPTANRQPPTARFTNPRCTNRTHEVVVETCDLMLFKRILSISEFCFAILQCFLITRHSDATFLQTH